MAAGTYSIKAEFDGAVVLITGASGYIGSVVLEQLLRTTNVARVFLLLRPRRGQSIQQRAKALLQGPLFHKVILLVVLAVSAAVLAAGECARRS